MRKMNPIASSAFAAITLLMLSTPSWAGSGGVRDGGNGGDVVFCDNPLPGEKKIELLDLFESRVLRQNTINLGQDGWDYSQRVEYTLSRLAKLDPHRAESYRTLISTFFQDSEFTQEELPDIPDSLHIALPKGCKIRQIVIQDASEHPVRKRFTINKPLWDMLDDQNRTALILHETIYHEAILIGHTDSIRTRFFNGTLNSKSFDSFSLEHYLDFLVQIGFAFRHTSSYGEKSFSFDDRNCWFSAQACDGGSIHSEDFETVKYYSHNIPGKLNIQFHNGEFRLKSFTTTTPTYSSNDHVKFTSLTLDENWKVIHGILAEAKWISSRYYTFYCEAGSELSFPPNFDVDHCILTPNGHMGQYPNTAIIENNEVELSEVTSVHQETGIVAKGSFRPGTKVQMPFGKCSFNGPFTTYPHGTVASAELVEKREVPFLIYSVPALGHVEFDESGNATDLKLGEDFSFKTPSGVVKLPAGAHINVHSPLFEGQKR